MEASIPGEITVLLRRLDDGDRDAIGALIPLVYQELKRTADAYLRREAPDHTLQPTALVHEVYLRLSARERPAWQNRRHFYRAAAIVMRTILINHARDRKRIKRGGGLSRRPLEDQVASYESRAVDLLALDESLRRLDAMDPHQAELIQLRFFVGLTLPEIADLLGISERTLRADWSLARAWLRREMDID